MPFSPASLYGWLIWFTNKKWENNTSTQHNHKLLCRPAAQQSRTKDRDAFAILLFYCIFE